jgi:hypothetical protein
MDTSLQPLLDVISTHEFEEFGDLYINAAFWADNDITLRLIVHQQDQADQIWRVLCKGVRRSRIINDRGISALSIKTEHPLLLPYTQPVAELYFSSHPSDPDVAVGRLMEAHRVVVGEWFDCMEFFNVGTHQPLRALLAGGFGKLAAGPQSLIDRYAEALRSSDVCVSSPTSRPPVWWNGKQWIEEVMPLSAVILERSYVVSPSVTAERE